MPSSPPTNSAGALVIPGIELGEELGQGAHSIVYRGVRDGQVVAVKVQRALAGSESSIRSFRREAAVLARLDDPALPRVYDAGEIDGRAYLIMDYVEGRPLDQVLAAGPVTLDSVVDLGRQLGGALAQVHRRGLVHRDLKPRNVLLCADGTARLLDFGLATAAGAGGDGDVAGTFLYAAPEQTGMIKRPVDGRADLYALGALLFECACGRPPFLSADAGELIRRHAVEQPPEPNSLNPAVGPALSLVLHKLLRKDPDDRYQSGEGLVGDLGRLEEIDRWLARGKSIVLGADDDSPRTASLAPFTGRQAELETLEGRWRRAAEGHGQIVFVEGEAGSGKTRLLQELVTSLRGSGVLVLAARCRRDEPRPFGPLRAAVEGYLERARRRTGLGRAAVEKRLREAAGTFAPLLKRISPAMANLLSDAPDLPQAADVGELFNRAFADFLVRLSDGTTAVCLMLDDVQWLDHASLSILERLAESISGARLLLVGAARRSAEPSEGVTWFRRFAPSSSLTLGPLSQADVGRIVAAHLGGRPLDGSFVRQLAVRSNGNPLAVEEYLEAMVESGLLRPTWDGWHVGTDGLESLELPTDVLQLVVMRLSGLRESSRRVLQAAALMGSRFEPGLLAEICEVEPRAVLDAVSEAAEAHLLERGEAEEYRFLHERIRDALVSELEAAEAGRLHRRIAEALDGARPGGDRNLTENLAENLADDFNADRIYALARHYALATDPDPIRAYRAIRAAGLHAAEGFAPEEAYSLLEQAAAMAVRGGLPADPILEQALGTVCARSGEQSEATEHLRRALHSATEPIERTRIRAQLIRVLLTNLEVGPAGREVALAFEEIGRRAPSGGPLRLLLAVALWLYTLVRRRLPLRRTGGRREERARILTELYEQAGNAAFVELRPGVMLEAGLRLFHLTLYLGPSRELVHAYLAYAFLLGVIRRTTAAQYYTDLAREVSKGLGDPFLAAWVELQEVFLTSLVPGRDRQAEAGLTRVLGEQERWLEPSYALIAYGALLANLLFRGYSAKALAWVERVQPRLDEAYRGSPKRVARGHFRIRKAAALAMLGRASEGVEEVAEVNAALAEAEPYFEVELLAFVAVYYLELGETGEPVEKVFARNAELDLDAALLPPYLQGIYVDEGWVRVAQCREASQAELPRRLRGLTQALRKLRLASHLPIFRCHYLALGAAEALFGGRRRRAHRLLARAEELARDVDSPWVAFEVARLRARLLLLEGNEPASEREARAAQSLALNNGWVLRAERVRTEFRLGDSTSGRDTGVTKSVRMSQAESSGARSVRLSRYLDSLLEVSLASASVLDPRQLAIAGLDQIVRLLGAERAFLFLLDETSGELRLGAGRDQKGRDLERPEAYSRTVVETVRARREPLVVTGTEEGAVLGSESTVAHGLRSIMAVPLLLRERLVGVLYLDSTLAKGVFTEEDVDILLAIGNHIAVALETRRAARLEIQLASERQQRRLAETLRDLAQTLSSTLELEEILERVLDSLASVVDYQRVALFLSRDDELQLVGSRGYEGLDRARLCEAIAAPTGLFARVAASGRPVVGGRDPGAGSPGSRQATEAPWIAEESPSYLAAPILSRERVAGMVLLEADREQAFSDHEVEIAFTFAGQLGIALENARLFGEVQRLARTDELTGTYTRRHFMELTERELRRAQRGAGPFSLIMLDIDHFKAVNDEHGHIVGDEVLRSVAQRCRRAVRDVDIVGRYGGEELAIALPNTEVQLAANLVAERVRKRIADEPIATPRGFLRVTVSLGVAGLVGGAESLEQLVDRADAALYRSKTGGRNLVSSG